jgi:hypothetical protein
VVLPQLAHALPQRELGVGLLFEPAVAPEGQLVLRNCPFASLREGCREVVCGMNLAMIEGVIVGLGLDGVTAALEPQPDSCCLALRATEAPTPSRDPALPERCSRSSTRRRRTTRARPA